MDEKDILVSVVIPTYSRNDQLGRAVDSVLNQTHALVEIIVVDDNHADSEYRAKAQEIMKAYEDNPRVTYIQNEKNMGGSGARNVGIEASHGDYIAFLDDDDAYLPEKVEKQLHLFFTSRVEKLALVYCYVEHIDNEGRHLCYVRTKKRGNSVYDAIMEDCIAATSQWMVKKEYVEAVGNFTIVPSKQDSTLILKLLQAGYGVDYVPEVLSMYANESQTNRISFSKGAIEGGRLYYEKCIAACEALTGRQKKKALYLSYGNMYWVYTRMEDREHCAEYEKKMRDMRPVYTSFWLKHPDFVRKVKNRLKRYGL